MNVIFPVVVISAPISDVVDTESEVAFAIAASRSRAPVIAIAPKPVTPPTIPSNSTSDVPTLAVSPKVPSTVLPKVI